MTLPRIRPDSVKLTQASANDLVAIAWAWNRDRRARGLPPLTVDVVLAKILRCVRELV